MVCPIVLKGPAGPQIYFNLGGSVGPSCPNVADDVQLVQLGYYAMLRNPLSQPPDALRQALAKIVPGAEYRGAPNDPLTLAIAAHEAFRGGPRDGHVSVARGAENYDAGHKFIIVILNNCLNATMRHDFPRLDKHPLCPGALRVSVLKMLLGGVG